MTSFARPGGLDQAIELLAAGDALALAGGSDVVPLVRRGKRRPATLVDIRPLLPSGIEPDGDGLRIGAGTTLAAIERDPRIAGGYAALQQAASAAASPQLRNVGTVGGNLAQAVRCWYYRHPDLTCWLNGGDTCYAQIGDHRKHGLEAGDCISVAPSDLSGPLAALGASVTLRGPGGEREIALLDLYARPDDAHRTALRLEPGELIVSLRLPEPPDASHYERAGERAAWSFALVARRGRAARRRAAPRRDRRHERAARARPCRSAARPRRARADGVEAASARGAQCACARSDRLGSTQTEPATASGSGVGPNCGYWSVSSARYAVVCWSTRSVQAPVSRSPLGMRPRKSEANQPITATAIPR